MSYMVSDVGNNDLGRRPWGNKQSKCPTFLPGGAAALFDFVVVYSGSKWRTGGRRVMFMIASLSLV